MKSSSSSYSFFKKYYGENINNLLSIKKKRNHLQQFQVSSAQTLRRFGGPQLAEEKGRTKHYSLEKTMSQRRMLKQLSAQLKEIKESLTSLSNYKKPKTSKSRSKVATEPCQEDDPKQKVVHQVLGQIEQLKRGRFHMMQPPEQHPNQPQPSSEERVLFYGMDYIDGVRFKIKIVLGEIYCLMAKNTHTKLRVEMSRKEYLALSGRLLSNNPCNVLRYLSIASDQILLRGTGLREMRTLKSYLAHY